MANRKSTPRRNPLIREQHQFEPEVAAEVIKETHQTTFAEAEPAPQIQTMERAEAPMANSVDEEDKLPLPELLKESEFISDDLDYDRLASTSRRGRPRKETLVRDKSSQYGLPPEWQRASFIVRGVFLDKLKDYAYTERITLKEALDYALYQFLKDKDNLMSHKRK